MWSEGHSDMINFRVVFASALLAGAHVWAGAVIDLRDNLTCCGVGTFPGFPTWGETFTAPNGTSFLTEFGILAYINNPNVNGTQQFYAYVMAWDGTEATGSVLYKSALTTMVETDTMTEYDYFTNVAVTPGSQYVAFVSADELSPNNNDRTTDFAFHDPPVYNGGTLVIQKAGPFSNVLQPNWTVGTDNENMGFLAEFDGGTPEPSTFVLLGTGLAGAAWMRRRRTYSKR